MKILIDILHPAHVHVFKNFIKTMEKRGHKIKITARDKDVTLQLLKHYKIHFIVLSKMRRKKSDLILELLIRTKKLIRIVRKFEPDIMMGCMGASIAPAGFLTVTPSLIFYNNEDLGIFNRFAQLIATRYITSVSWEQKVWGNHVTHSSYHELAYLHPDEFTPDKNILKKAKIKTGQRFIIVRFSALGSIHDIGVKGIHDRAEFIEKLSKHAKVILTSEKPLPKELEKYRLRIPPHKLHDLLSFATLCIGDSATLAAEAACLGVPGIYIATSMRGYTNELENRYDLVYNFKSQKQALNKAEELLKDKNLKKKWKNKRQIMLQERINMTKWMIDYVEGKGWKK
jgi:uncharacterized protein